MKIRDFVIVAGIVAVLLWVFTRRKKQGCGCAGGSKGPQLQAFTKTAAARKEHACGPFACGR